ncbi:MAG: hypothetical protein OQK23_06820, partial [Rhodospirillales bacterium]|nr:hypothetical protein [Rhodospirillales bacterium]
APQGQAARHAAAIYDDVGFMRHGGSAPSLLPAIAGSGLPRSAARQMGGDGHLPPTAVAEGGR